MPQQLRGLFRTGIMLGAGMAGTLDEVVFHQLLQWHNFYVATTQTWRLVSDGLFHAFSATLLVLAAWRFWHGRYPIGSAAARRTLSGGLLLGAGGFNLYDGTIQHKILRLHPIREGVPNQLPYDLAWNLVALALVLLGLWLWRGVRAHPEAAAD